MARYDAIVMGGGVVGSAIAYGLVRDGLRVVLVDEGDVAYRASRGNFGLVWVQSKGDGAPHYQRWTRRSADEWPALAAELMARTGIPIGHERPGGVHLCLGEAELEARQAMMERMRVQSSSPKCCRVSAPRSPAPPGPPVTGTPTRSTCCTRSTKALSRRAAVTFPTPPSTMRNGRPTIFASPRATAKSGRRKWFSPRGWVGPAGRARRGSQARPYRRRGARPPRPADPRRPRQRASVEAVSRPPVPSGAVDAGPGGGPLIEEWLMKNDFQPVVGHSFNFRAQPMPHWNGVVDCQVLAVEPCRWLSYRWNASGEEAAGGLKTVVTWTLTPTKAGVLLRVEQSGFRPEDETNYQGASHGWQRYIAGLERVVAGLDR